MVPVLSMTNTEGTRQLVQCGAGRFLEIDPVLFLLRNGRIVQVVCHVERLRCLEMTIGEQRCNGYPLLLDSNKRISGRSVLKTRSQSLRAQLRFHQSHVAQLHVAVRAPSAPVENNDGGL